MEATQRRRKVEVSLDPVGRRDRQWGWYLWLTTAAEEDVSSAIASSAVRFITLCASAITVHILANLIITEQKGNGNSSVISSFLYHARFVPIDLFLGGRARTLGRAA